MTDEQKNEGTPNPVTEGAAATPTAPTQAARPGSPAQHNAAQSDSEETPYREVEEGVEARSVSPEELAERAAAAANES